jgi:hypothetical protein
MGEIMKLKRDDRVPYLEVIIEMENDKVNPQSQFIYLHSVEETIDIQELNEQNIFRVERLEWAENIGKSYLKLDFDRSKK